MSPHTDKVSKETHLEHSVATLLILLAAECPALVTHTSTQVKQVYRHLLTWDGALLSSLMLTLTRLTLPDEVAATALSPQLRKSIAARAIESLISAAANENTNGTLSQPRHRGRQSVDYRLRVAHPLLKLSVSHPLCEKKPE